MNMTSTARPTESELSAPLEGVIRRLRACSGFPTLSTTISDINRVVATDSHSTRQLTQVILRDVSLTTKLLQVVNSAIYGQYRGRIRTISKAVLILGCDQLRSIATALMMLEFAKGRPQAKSLQDELIGGFFAGVVAKSLCQRLGMPNSEEAVICTMFQSLGKLLSIFFLYEETRQIRVLMATGLPEELAAERVLGISYRELGIGIARHWNFPDRLVEGMQSLSAREIVPPKSDIERLKIAANFANELYLTALRSAPADRTAALQALSRRYGAAIKLDSDELIAVLEHGLKEVAQRSATLELPAASSPALAAIRTWAGGAPNADENASEANQASDAAADDTLTRRVDALDSLDEDHKTAVSPQQVLSAGIRDVTEALTLDVALNDVLQMVLETMYRGMAFSRTMIFIRDVRLDTMRARSGFGAEIDRIISQCSFPLTFAPDVFHIAMEKGVDIVIENTQADNIVERIPHWYRDVVGAKSFLLLPVVLRKDTVGLLYADSDGAGIKIAPEQLGMLRTLRSQVTLAFKHCGAASRS
ncbi:MAG: HDOD domain-containing protein [Steroidobacter sp.]